jgi:hypothetical protein
VPPPVVAPIGVTPANSPGGLVASPGSADHILRPRFGRDQRWRRQRDSRPIRQCRRSPPVSSRRARRCQSPRRRRHRLCFALGRIVGDKGAQVGSGGSAKVGRGPGEWRRSSAKADVDLAAGFPLPFEEGCR